MRPKPALRSELLFYLSFLAAFALLVGVAGSLLALAPDQGIAMIVTIVVLEGAIFILYGRGLVNRLVLRPLDRVVAAADSVADGNLDARAPDAEGLCSSAFVVSRCSFLRAGRGIRRAS